MDEVLTGTIADDIDAALQAAQGFIRVKSNVPKELQAIDWNAWAYYASFHMAVHTAASDYPSGGLYDVPTLEKLRLSLVPKGMEYDGSPFEIVDEALRLGYLVFRETIGTTLDTAEANLSVPGLVFPKDSRYTITSVDDKQSAKLQTAGVIECEVRVFVIPDVLLAKRFNRDMPVRISLKWLDKYLKKQAGLLDGLNGI